MNQIDKKLIDKLIFDGNLYVYKVLLFEPLTNIKGYFYVGETTISNQEELNKHLEIYNKIGEDILNEFGSNLEEVYYSYINKTIAFLNRHIINIHQLEYSQLKENFAIDDIKNEFNEVSMTMALDLILKGIYHISKLNVDFEKITLSSLQATSRNGRLIPIFGKSGILLKKEGEKLVTSFKIITEDSFNQIVDYLLIENNKNIDKLEARQRRNYIKRLSDDSIICFDAIYLYLNNEDEQEFNHLLYSYANKWIDLVGVDLTNLIK